jgi:hypothetical protein
MTQPIQAQVMRARRTPIMLLAASLILIPLAAFAGKPTVLAQATVTGQADKIATPPTKPETIEQRIAGLKASLKITPDETDNWNAVAAAMRSNAEAMDKLAASKRAQPVTDQTALDDLLTYQAFAQAHVDGLATLTTRFTVLYNSMPDAQKKVADSVFRSFGRSSKSVKG